ncbi:helix-turn-helix transcriptional regulator [Haloechinothrix sp. LS1_15]|uniref:helix-turn-helix domain-containing protein n=1 Tax=Haloechinothrix sp. LS1_15 TaxID=2652248 RepID=UPI00294781C4|nr:helix-turn-helix transcriptional regulator [Haloechinothrix sp. LS1_15]MDV6013585.1 helix-turn-helix domain-containing protein [Haloechinothrix sp. LS1_15]
MRPVSLFGSELRRAREELGWSRDKLAEEINFSASLVEKVETGTKPPSVAFTREADRVLGTEGLLGRIREHLLTQEGLPEWFRSWYEIEQEAAAIWWYELLLIPGLLQSEDYAHALLGGDESKVSARLERQEILTRESPPPPELVMLVDERALRYPMAGPQAMRAQLEHIMTVAERYVVQVVPIACGTHLHLDGSFGIGVVDGREYVYVDTPARGFVLDSPDVLSSMKRRWDLIRAEALPRRQSTELIREVAEQWTT